MKSLIFTILLLIGFPGWSAEFIPFDGFAARAISADGLSVVGNETTESGFLQSGIVRWRLSSGPQVVDSFQSVFGGIITDVSDNGSVISAYENVSGSVVPMVWKESTGITILEKASPTSVDIPIGVSGNGNLIVGYNFSPCCEGYGWDAAGTIQDKNIATPHGPPNVGEYGAIFSASSDGSAISVLNTLGAYHKAGEIMTLIHPFEFIGAQSKISSDGEFVVGYYQNEAYRFNLVSGRLGLGLLPDPASEPPEKIEVMSRALDVSANGRVIVGFSENVSEEMEAFIWDEFDGMQSLKQRVLFEGADVQNWIFHSALAVSDDGLTIIGEGINPSGSYQTFLVELNEETNIPMLPYFGVVFLGFMVFLIAYRSDVKKGIPSI